MNRKMQNTWARHPIHVWALGAGTTSGLKGSCTLETQYRHTLICVGFTVSADFFSANNGLPVPLCCRARRRRIRRLRTRWKQSRSSTPAHQPWDSTSRFPQRHETGVGNYQQNTFWMLLQVRANSRKFRPYPVWVGMVVTVKQPSLTPTIQQPQQMPSPSEMAKKCVRNELAANIVGCEQNVSIKPRSSAMLSIWSESSFGSKKYMSDSHPSLRPWTPKRIVCCRHPFPAAQSCENRSEQLFTTYTHAH